MQTEVIQGISDLTTSPPLELSFLNVSLPSHIKIDARLHNLISE